MVTTTKAYAEGFVRECARLGLNAKQASVLLWRQRMNEAIERPIFGKAFIGELEKQGAGAPSLAEQINASLADKGGLGANVGHYAGRGAMVGGATGLGLAGLSLLGKRRSLRPTLTAAQKAVKGSAGLKNKAFFHPVNWGAGAPGDKLKYWLKRPLRWAGQGAAGGAGLGALYGGKKTWDNTMFMPLDVINPGPQEPRRAPGTTLGGVRDPYSYTGAGIPVAQPGAAVTPGMPSNRAASDFVREDKKQLLDFDKRIADLERQRAAAPGIGQPVGVYAEQAGIEQQLSHVRQMRNLKQKQINDALRNLQIQQQRTDAMVTRTLPRVMDQRMEQQRMADASQQMRRADNGMLSRMLQWLGGQPKEYDPTYDYLRRVNNAQGVERHLRNIQENPPYYR